METITAFQGETIDALCYRYYGLNNMVATVMEANPQLARLPMNLPEGTKVNMPERVEKTNKTRLWD